MVETTHGIFVQDYKKLDLIALEELIRLDQQLDRNLQKIREFIIDGDYPKALVNLRWLIEDNLHHRDYCAECQEEIFKVMECTDASNHSQNYPYEEEFDAHYE